LAIDADCGGVLSKTFTVFVDGHESAMRDQWIDAVSEYPAA
jgi:hypothetical protein